MEAKHTPGPCQAMRGGMIQNGCGPFAEAYMIPRMLGDYEANAELIAEAFNVATETGLTPRQLAEQVAQLRAMVGRCIDMLELTSEWGNRAYSIRTRLKAIDQATGKEQE